MLLPRRLVELIVAQALAPDLFHRYLPRLLALLDLRWVQALVQEDNLILQLDLELDHR